MPRVDLCEVLCQSEDNSFVVPRDPARDHLLMGSDGETIYLLEDPDHADLPIGAYEAEEAVQQRVTTLLLYAAYYENEAIKEAVSSVREAVSVLNDHMKRNNLTLSGVVLAPALAHALEERFLEEAARFGLKDFRVFECPLNLETTLLGVCQPVDLGFLIVLPTEEDGLLQRGIGVHNPAGVKGLRYLLN